MENNVYILASLTEDRRSEGFGFVDMTSMLGLSDIYDDFSTLDPDKAGQARQLTDLWVPREVEGHVSPEFDFPAAGPQVPVFSARAVDALRDLLAPNGELLPLIAREAIGSYFAYNVRTVAARALDATNSVIPSDDHLRGIAHHEFVPERLGSLSIFRIPENPGRAYVTDVFASRVRKHDLQGFHFQKVWPLPKGSDWWRLALDEMDLLTGRRGKQAVKPKLGRSAPVRRVISRPLAPGPEADSFAKSIRDYEKHIGFAASRLSVDEVHARIDQALNALQGSTLADVEKQDRGFWLGIAWGEATVRGLGWEWAMLENDRGQKTIAVVSRDRAHAVTVLNYIERLATQQDADVTSHLLYNMLALNDVTPAVPGELKLLG